MVIFDTTNNYNNQIKGMLHMSIMDVDYLMQKYQAPFLKSMTSVDYVKIFEDELKQRKNEDKLSEQYYSILSLGIETDKDEELLKIIKNEVEQGNLFTKSTLQAINHHDLKNSIKSLTDNADRLDNENLYKLRSYMMVECICDAIEKAKTYEERLYNHTATPGVLSSYENIVSNLEAMGLSSKITESDYFTNAKTLRK